MDFSDGLPPALRTLVVIPTLLQDVRGIDDLLEALEVRFLANRGSHLHFALLTDFQDADQETVAGDDQLVLAAGAGIDALNAKYAGEDGDTFFSSIARVAGMPMSGSGWDTSGSEANWRT